MLFLPKSLLMVFISYCCIIERMEKFIPNIAYWVKGRMSVLRFPLLRNRKCFSIVQWKLLTGALLLELFAAFLRVKSILFFKHISDGFTQSNVLLFLYPLLKIRLQQSFTLSVRFRNNHNVRDKLFFVEPFFHTRKEEIFTGCQIW